MRQAARCSMTHQQQDAFISYRQGVGGKCAPRQLWSTQPSSSGNSVWRAAPQATAYQIVCHSGTQPTCTPLASISTHFLTTSTLSEFQIAESASEQHTQPSSHHLHQVENCTAWRLYSPASDQSAQLRQSTIMREPGWWDRHLDRYADVSCRQTCCRQTDNMLVH